MPKAFIEPETMSALVEVFHEARRLLQHQGITESDQLDAVARRILDLACKGTPPRLILREILPPMSPERAGMPEIPIDQAIAIHSSSQASPL